MLAFATKGSAPPQAVQTNCAPGTGRAPSELVRLSILPGLQCRKAEEPGAIGGVNQNRHRAGATAGIVAPVVEEADAEAGAVPPQLPGVDQLPLPPPPLQVRVAALSLGGRLAASNVTSTGQVVVKFICFGLLVELVTQ